MDLGINERVAIVSGGSKGIGFATAQEFVKEGVKTVIAARNEETLKSAAAKLDAMAPGNVRWVSADMTDASGVRHVVETARQAFGPVDIAVSNVIGHVIDPEQAGPHAGYFEDVSPSDYHTEFRQLFLSAWYLAKEVVEDMKARKWGRIVNVGSGVAREPTSELPHILPNTVRPAVAGLYRSMAYELAADGVTVNNILTGSIATERNSDYFTWLAKERQVDRDEMLKEMYASGPIQRPGKPEEMAGLIAFLCSAQADAISGQSIAVTGGRTKHIY